MNETNTSVKRGSEEWSALCEIANMNTTKAEKEMIDEIRDLLSDLKTDIADDYRASDDPSDDTPGMQVTVSTSDMRSWNYQTGDNSFSGACYGDPHWSVIYLYRDSDVQDLAETAVSELADQYAVNL